MGKVICHDGTPFVNYECPECHFVMHVHKSQLPVFMDRVILLTFCKGCGTELVLPEPTEWVGEEVKQCLRSPEELHDLKIMIKDLEARGRSGYET